MDRQLKPAQMTAGTHAVPRRCPTAMECTEIRVFTVAGRTTDEPDVVLQVYRRLNHDLSSPWGPSSAAVRVPARYAPRLAELIIEAAAGETTTDETGASPQDGPADTEERH